MTAAISDVPLVSFTVPIRTVSEANQRGHWAKKAKRVASHRMTAGFATMAHLRSEWLVRRPHPTGARGMRLALRQDIAFTISLTRIASRALDSDNLTSATKAARDGVADALGIDDRDPRVTWEYAQERGAKGQYGVRVEIRRRA